MSTTAFAPLQAAARSTSVTRAAQPAVRRVLIVSPNFPPSSSPDMQRVRMSLPYFREFGWEPVVLAVAQEPGSANDPLLSLTVPADVRVVRVKAAPEAITRRIGVGNIALRALPSLNREAMKLLRAERFDLVYFSTTMFFAVPLGRWWRARTGVPFVVDLQDPWYSDYYETHPGTTPPKKHALSSRVHRVLEKWTMAAAGGIVAVSGPYISTLRRRYPRLQDAPAVTLPFAASKTDFDLLETAPQANRYFAKEDGLVHGAYAGRAGDDMRAALRILFGALHEGRTLFPSEFERVRLHFVGTSYSNAPDAPMTVAPVAAECGSDAVVTESTARAPYFTALQVLKDASFLVLIGSDDPDYTASKVYPYLLAGKPIVAVVHERSSLVPVLRAARHTVLVTFSGDDDGAARAVLVEGWRALLRQLPISLPYDETALAPYSAREMTRQQCTLFDAVVSGRKVEG